MNICLTPFMISRLMLAGNILWTIAEWRLNYLSHPHGGALFHPACWYSRVAARTCEGEGRACISWDHWWGAASSWVAPLDYACYDKAMILHWCIHTHKLNSLMLSIADQILSPAVSKFCMHVLPKWFHQLSNKRVDWNHIAFSLVFYWRTGAVDVQFFLKQSQTCLHIITEILTQK